MWGGVGGGLIAYGFHFHLHCLHLGRMGLGGVGGGLLAYGFHYHLHCLNPGRMGVGWAGWGVDSIRFPLPFALSKSWKNGCGVGWVGDC